MKHTCCTILLCLFFSAINAQVPDNSFGANGKVVIPYYANEYINVSSVLLQTDGKILIGGYDYDADFYSPSILVWRLNSDGSVDENFGTAGYVRILNNPDGTAHYGGFLALQPDNKIVILGNNFDRDGELSERIVLFRLKPDGSFDSTFGKNGKAYFNFGGFRQTANALLIKPNGKILVTGQLFINSGGSQRVELIQFLPNGKIDSSFGVNGIASSGKDYQQEGLSLALTSDNKIIAGYRCKIDNVRKTGLASFNANGTVDKSFGINGTVLNKDVIAASDSKMSIAIQPNGKIIEYVSTGSDNFLYRYNANGSIDKVFGADGHINVPANTSVPLSVITDVKQRRILINTPEFSISGYKADGAIDASFGTSGKLDVDFTDIIPNPFDLKSEQILLQPDSKILSAGYIIDDRGNTQFAVARFENTGNTLNATATKLATENNVIALYPNPVTSVLNIKGLNANNNYGFSIINAKGDIVAIKKNIQANFYSWDIQQLSSGMYYLNIASGNQKIAIKFIKR